MKRIFLSKYQKIILLLIWVSFNVNAQESCEQILKYGIYDTAETKIDQSKAVWYVHKFISDNNETYSKAKSMDASATIPVDTILIKLGFGKSEGDYKQLKSYMENYVSLNREEKLKLEQALKTININVVSAWSACLDSDGTKFFIIYTDDPNVFMLAGYVNHRGGSIPTITSGGFNKKVTILTDGPFFTRDGKLKINEKVPFARSYQTFERKTAEPIILNVNFSQGKGYQISIPGIDQGGKVVKTDDVLTEVPLKIDWTQNVEIPKNKVCTLSFVGELKFLDPNVHPGQFSRNPALNSQQLSLNFPASILEYRIIELDDANNVINTGPGLRWDGNQTLLKSSKLKRRIETRIRTCWLEKVDEKVNVSRETHAQDYFMDACTRNSGTINLSSKLLVER
jgi:hypothetical protein